MRVMGLDRSVADDTCSSTARRVQARLTCFQAETRAKLLGICLPFCLRRHVWVQRRSALQSGHRRESRIHSRREGDVALPALADGAVLWKWDTVRQFGVVQNFFGVAGPPIVEGRADVVIGGVRRGQPLSRENDRVSGNGTGIVAFDKHTGEVRYTVTDELACYSGPTAATMAVDAGVLPSVAEDWWGSSLRRAKWTSTMRARSLLDSVNASTPLIVQDEVFISET